MDKDKEKDSKEEKIEYVCDGFSCRPVTFSNGDEFKNKADKGVMLQINEDEEGS